MVSSFPPHDTSWDATDATKHRREPDGVWGLGCVWGLGARKSSTTAVSPRPTPARLPCRSGSCTTVLGWSRTVRNGTVPYGVPVCSLRCQSGGLAGPGGHEKTKGTAKTAMEKAMPGRRCALASPATPLGLSPGPSIFRLSPHPAEHTAAASSIGRLHSSSAPRGAGDGGARLIRWWNGPPHHIRPGRPRYRDIDDSCRA